MNKVNGIGPSTAKIAVVGEFPSAEEERLGQPFTGAAGRMVREIFHQNGIDFESSVYRTNVLKVRPPKGKVKDLKMLGCSIEDFTPLLWDELTKLRPNVILALGDTALKVLTGEVGIKKWRGSILQALRAPCKVIPTIHPAFIHQSQDTDEDSDEDSGMGSYKDLTYIKWDFARAIAESNSRELNLPRHELKVCRSSLDFWRFREQYKNSELVSVDIETFRTIPQCISFAFNRNHAISVPLFNIQSVSNPTGIPRHDTLQLWKDCADILADPRIGKIGQNFKFDSQMLECCVNGTKYFGMPVRSFYFDTHLAFRTLYPELPASLGFIGSVLTRVPYYKDEGKEYNPKKDKLDKLLLYNAKDAVVTFEAYEEELKELRERGLEDFFFNRVMPLHFFYSGIEQQGILRDKVRQKQLLDKYETMQEELEKELLTLTNGEPVNVMSNGVKGQVARLVYIEWGLPIRKGTDEKTLSALLRNNVKDPNHKKGLELILKIRKVRKTIGTYIKAKEHPDGRLRTGCRIMLETGRSATSILKSPVTTEKFGMAFQTITKHGDVGTDLRSQFIPDPGYVLIEPDLSQAEDRVVAVLSKDFDALKIFEFGIDRHRLTTAKMAACAPDDLMDLFIKNPNQELADKINKLLKATITEEARQQGKKGRHAANYDVGKRTFAAFTGVSEWRAGKILDSVHQTNPNIRAVFHAEVIKALEENNRTLINPFGRARQFLNRWGKQLFKEAYAQIPQSTVSDQLKFAAIRVAKRCPWLIMLLECHDSFLAQAPLVQGSLYPFRLIDETCKVIKEELESPINFKNCTLSRDVDLIIPSETKISETNWEDMRKYA